MPHSKHKTFVLSGLLLMMTMPSLQARTKLTALPEREQSRIDLSHSGQAFIEEDRTINLSAGLNHIDFSWAGTKIIKDSIIIRPIASQTKIKILNASYPPNEDALFWEVFSPEAGPQAFRISYLIHGFQKKPEYVLMAEKNEQKADLQCRVNLANHSGENFEQSQIQLGDDLIYDDKEMLHNQIRRMAAFRSSELPLSKIYRFHPQHGNEVRYYYHLENTLKKGTWPAGKTRVYLRNSQNSETFVGEDWIAATPPGGHSDVFLGQARDIKCKADLMKHDRERLAGDLWFHQHQVMRWQLQNFKEETITLEIEQPMNEGEWEFKNVRLMLETGEGQDREEQELSLDPVSTEIVHNQLIRFKVELPPTGHDQRKWNLYAEWSLKNRGF